MKWNGESLAYCSFLRLLLIATLLTSLTGCSMFSAGKEHAFNTGTSVQLSETDSKWYTFAYLWVNAPHMIKPWQAERQGKREATDKLKEQMDVDVAGAFLKIGNMALSGYQTGGIGGILALGGILFREWARRRKEREIEGAKAKALEDERNKHFLELGMKAYKGRRHDVITEEDLEETRRMESPRG